MKFKNIALTDIIAGISAIALTVTMASQIYFYCRVDAIWLLSVISPSILFIEVLRVLFLIFILYFFSILIKELYGFILKVIIKKKRIIYNNNQNEITRILIKKRKQYVNGHFLFLILCIYGCVNILIYYDISISNSVSMLFSFTMGAISKIITDKERDSVTKNVSFSFVVLSVIVLNSEIKISNLSTAPIVILSGSNQINKDLKLLYIQNEKAILFSENKSKYEFTVVQLAKIDKIIANSSMN